MIKTLTYAATIALLAGGTAVAAPSSDGSASTSMSGSMTRTNDRVAQENVDDAAVNAHIAQINAQNARANEETAQLNEAQLAPPRTGAYQGTEAYRAPQGPALAYTYGPAPMTTTYGYTAYSYTGFGPGWGPAPYGHAANCYADDTCVNPAPAAVHNHVQAQSFRASGFG